MKKSVLFFCVCACLIAVNAFADTVVLKTGQKIEGTILERGNETIKIRFEGVDLSYVLSEVDFINGEKIKPASSVVDLQAPENKQDAGGRGATTVPPAPGTTLSQTPQPFSLQQNATSSGARTPATMLSMIAVGVAIVVIIVIVVFYVFGAICLQLIAKKTQAEPVWMAWVPLANLFLMCKIAQVSFWWLLLFLGAFIPYLHLNIICMAVFNGFVWYKIAVARNKPGWVGVLSVIPIVHLGVMGYLAFSE